MFYQFVSFWLCRAGWWVASVVVPRMIRNVGDEVFGFAGIGAGVCGGAVG